MSLRGVYSKFGKMNSVISTVLIDLSGTLHIGDKAIPGAVEALKQLRSADLKIRFVTNTTKESVVRLHNRLVSLGFDINKNEIFSSLTAAKSYITKYRLRPYLMIHKDAMEDFHDVDTTEPNAVLVGLSPSHFEFEPMNKAFRMVLDGAALVAIHKARYFKDADELCLGPGAFVSALEYATDRHAYLVGKPNPIFFGECVKPLTSDMHTAVMIGDDVRDDVEGAMAVGIHGILVKTGKYTAGDENILRYPPTTVLADFATAVKFILASNEAIHALRHGLVPPPIPQSEAQPNALPKSKDNTASEMGSIMTAAHSTHSSLGSNASTNTKHQESESLKKSIKPSETEMKKTEKTIEPNVKSAEKQEQHTPKTTHTTSNNSKNVG